MAAPRRAFVSSSGASGRPRSAKTLPLPCITRSTVFLAISLLIIPLCHLQPCMHHSNIGLAGLNSTRRLLLEGVQDIDGLLESNRVDRPVGITIVVADDFKNPRPLALPRLGGQVLTYLQTERRQAQNRGCVEPPKEIAWPPSGRSPSSKAAFLPVHSSVSRLSYFRDKLSRANDS